jgi:hypothetical protein
LIFLARRTSAVCVSGILTAMRLGYDRPRPAAASLVT